MRRATRTLIAAAAGAVALLVAHRAEWIDAGGPDERARQTAHLRSAAPHADARAGAGAGVRPGRLDDRIAASLQISAASDRRSGGTAVVEAIGRSPAPPLVDRVADAGRSDHAEASSSWPYLHPPVVTPGRLTTRIEGHDPVGARSLWLWRRGPEGVALLERTRSEPDGHFDFGELPIPNEDFALVVTGAGGDPRSASSTDATRRDLPPPGFAAMIDAQAVRVELHPAVLGGELWVMDDAGIVWRWFEAGRERAVVEIAGDDLARGHSVMQVLADGRRSASTPIHVAVAKD